MDIGTAKPSKELQQRVPHHLIDILEPDEQFDLGAFVRRADELVQEILNRGKIPVISGGTAFYLKHFIYGLPSAPRSDPAVRAELRDELDKKGLAALFRELEQIDPPSAGRIEPGDAYRVIRALEVYRVSGKPLSAYTPPSSPRPGLNILSVGLYREREELNRRIDRRVERMFEEGLVDEVKTLMRRGFGPKAPGMKGIGYREFFVMRESGCITFPRLKEMIQQHSRRYAKRQMTFFRSIPGVVWINPEDVSSLEKWGISP